MNMTLDDYTREYLDTIGKPTEPVIAAAFRAGWMAKKYGRRAIVSVVAGAHGRCRMMLTPIEIADLRGDHGYLTPGPRLCVTCDVDWPCLEARLMDDRDRAVAALDKLLRWAISNYDSEHEFVSWEWMLETVLAEARTITKEAELAATSGEKQ